MSPKMRLVVSLIMPPIMSLAIPLIMLAPRTLVWSKRLLKKDRRAEATQCDWNSRPRHKPVTSPGPQVTCHVPWTFAGRASIPWRVSPLADRLSFPALGHTHRPAATAAAAEQLPPPPAGSESDSAAATTRRATLATAS